MAAERPANQTFQDLEQIASALRASGGKRILHDIDGTVRDQFGISLETDDSDIFHDLVIDLERKTLVITDLEKPQEEGSKLFPKIATITYEAFEGFEVFQGQNAVRFYGADWGLTLQRYWDTTSKLSFNAEGKSPTVEVVPENIKNILPETIEAKLSRST